jgi:hypothetical protein
MVCGAPHIMGLLYAGALIGLDMVQWFRGLHEKENEGATSRHSIRTEQGGGGTGAAA